VHQLSCENWENVFMEDVNIIYNNFINTYVRIFNTNFPLVKIKNSQNSKPWLTKGIKISCVNKRRLYMNYRKSKNATRDIVRHYLKLLMQIKDYITASSYYSLTTNKKLHGI